MGVGESAQRLLLGSPCVKVGRWGEDCATWLRWDAQRACDGRARGNCDGERRGL